MVTFEQLVRFSVGDHMHYGELINTDGNSTKCSSLMVLPSTSCFQQIESILCLTYVELALKIRPLKSLNQQTSAFIAHPKYSHDYLHAKEVSLNVPTYPPVFTEPTYALAGKDTKNVSTGNALDFVIKYTPRDDLSERNFQLAEASGNFATPSRSTSSLPSDMFSSAPRRCKARSR
ncbi:uncharacterized protein BO88DRAFT_451567 [Aspergillus vadensis CBS 113365]|uniref:Uncharacterized protein n=1 Tax=Aspergillus vadensis (strain CBS 113365 / IMI 142717 / IBT 24658) TaxID=1448311 RepID=A0A319BGZ1_ASPVC|nr:hypothetical protein BO88DRAFT_451567 [Aspergillus vadensis CBS 113365]PYH71897.1 hypothetical protein BO88DRAFT_451567 [Aspergillus vadensis CBS 113365]